MKNPALLWASVPLFQTTFIDEFVSILKDWQIVFKQYPISLGGASYA